MFFVLIAVTCALIYLLKFCHAPASWSKTTVKTLSVATLTLAAILGGGPVLLIVALAFCTAGDYLLSRDSETTFLAGVGAFAAGHIAYVALFLTNPMAQVNALTAPLNVLCVVCLLIYGSVIMRLLYRRTGPLKFAVMGYVPIILSMGIAALTLPSSGMMQLVVPSAVLFMISDSVLATELFLLRPDHPMRRIMPYVVWSLYWLAQLGFLLAFNPV